MMPKKTHSKQQMKSRFQPGTLLESSQPLMKPRPERAPMKTKRSLKKQTLSFCQPRRSP